ncbi:MAG: indolepyruvate ferredoxin oxidoreductase [Bacteroidetes bacterium GWA2_30_7]|nr:MAG: indolepyruvate ferredoxin oxidoreductase [Bacteroidetes bacterium GWA2_30_7]
MKHVGLNVAADAFVNSAITGANGGIVYTIADDPSMHSSQNEQDSRVLAKFALIPTFEPSNQQEAYDMAYFAFEFSEKYKVPVMLRITTRLAHSRAGVQRKEIRKQNSIKLPENPLQFVLLPSVARKHYKNLLANQESFRSESEISIFNKYFEGSDKSMGIIACGIAYNYLMENFQNKPLNFPVLKVGQYPVPRKIIKKMVEETDSILLLEDGYPVIEELLKGMLGFGINVKGRLDGTVPRDGELNPNIVGIALGLIDKHEAKIPDLVVNRPPIFCDGCGHIDMYNALNEAMRSYGKGRVFSDIGCYTMGALPPYSSIYSCVDMGASITMAKGASDAGLIPSACVIGDSTFTHSGITGLLDCIVENTPVTIIISDNSTTGMTGGQNSHGYGRIINICKGCGVDPEHIKVINPMKKYHEENTNILKKEFEYNGVSVVIAQRECIQTMKRRNSQKFAKAERN